ncbi:HNH endonuclease [Paenibacillus pasadenensis]|uniref:HNH endonuclease n=1 Tax=Paenibacillus pasadenensis TaxID=217090 RepID=UPI002041855D|nr:HNH endonuclease signature motif containing protein [Paenibacillus pasadenensis]MCM3748254.1 HNH endonuclease [Paenibacillus pasadenensis]
MDTKQCAVCGRDKPEGAFPKRTGRKGRRGTCRACQRRRKRDTGSEEAAFVQPSPAASRRAAARPAAALQTAGEQPGPPAEFRPAAAARPAAHSAPVTLALDPLHSDKPSLSELSSAVLDTDGGSQEDAGQSKRKRKRRRRRKTRKAVVAGHSHTPGTRLPFKPIKPFKGAFSYDPSVLNDRGTGMIQLRGRRESGKRWHTEIDRDIAVRMVQEGAAGILHPRLIHKLYTKSDFRLLILQRDNYVCHYCGRFGDTIDHVFPKSKGGLSTPANCVCACSACNLKKADTLPDYL